MNAVEAAVEAQRLLLVDDDDVFREVLRGALARRGFEVEVAADLAATASLLKRFQPQLAIVDLKLPDGSGLELVAGLAALEPAPRVLVLTGYASIATAVEAVKLGAVNYLPKPATPSEILAALAQDLPDASVPLNEGPPSVDRMAWEHIQRVLAEHGGNVSATARALNMHRRTLQRKLAKRPVRR